MSFSNFLELELLDHVFGAAAYTAPATVYVSLHTADPTDAGSGAEVSGGSYARAAVTNDATNWPAAASGSKSNGAVIQFATPTGSWGTITHFGIWDALTTGNLLAHGALDTSKAPSTGVDVEFGVGDLTITLD